MESNNKYVVSGLGFFVGYVDEKIFPKEPIWTGRLDEAKSLTSNQAKNLCNTVGVECFIWSPFAQQSKGDKKYKVVKRGIYYDFLNSEGREVLEWMVVKDFSQKNDFEYLETVKSNKVVELYDLETAEKIAREKNEKILEEITKILNK